MISKSHFNKRKILYIGMMIFVLSMTLRIWNLSKIGQVWDEQALLQLSYRHLELAMNFDFGNSFWWRESIPDHPPLVRYLRAIASLPDIQYFDQNNKPVFSYNLTFNRLLSALLASLGTVLVFLIGKKYVSLFTGITGAIIFSMLPIPLGHSQLGMLEPLGLFFFTASMYTFILFLNNPTKKMVILSSIALGFALLARETHFMLMPMMLIIYFVKTYKKRSKNPNKVLRKIFLIFTISLILFVAMWPWPFLHLDYMIEFTKEMRVTNTGSIPELFFGRLMLVPEVYYFTHFIITTPFLILLLALIGLKKIDRSKNWVWYTFVIWLCFPFIMSLYPKKEQGIRYIIQICAPLALIAAMGLERVIGIFTNEPKTKYIALSILTIYLFVILVRITPYYTNYFNILVGGAKGVYEKKLFHLGWWGEGSREAMEYLINNAPHGSKIGLATSPSHTFPPFPEAEIEIYEEGKTYDYVIVNYYHIYRIGFDDSNIRKNYSKVYEVMADGAPIYEIYKAKNSTNKNR